MFYWLDIQIQRGDYAAPFSSYPNMDDDTLAIQFTTHLKRKKMLVAQCPVCPSLSYNKCTNFTNLHFKFIFHLQSNCTLPGMCVFKWMREWTSQVFYFLSLSNNNRGKKHLLWKNGRILHSRCPTHFNGVLFLMYFCIYGMLTFFF